MEKDKLCPLLTAAKLSNSYYANYDDHTWHCEKEKCAWYNHKHETCGILKTFD